MEVHDATGQGEAPGIVNDRDITNTCASLTQGLMSTESDTPFFVLLCLTADGFASSFAGRLPTEIKGKDAEAYGCTYLLVESAYDTEHADTVCAVVVFPGIDVYVLSVAGFV